MSRRPSPSATTTSASQGVGAAAASRSAERSQGSVRRRSTICGSREPKAPCAPAGGKVPRIWSGGSVNRGATTSSRAAIGLHRPGQPGHVAGEHVAAGRAAAARRTGAARTFRAAAAARHSGLLPAAPACGRNRHGGRWQQRRQAAARRRGRDRRGGRGRPAGAGDAAEPVLGRAVTAR